MKTLAEYKGFTGSAEEIIDAGVYRGKILGIKDLVSYQAYAAQHLQKAFESAVDDYILTSHVLGRQAPGRTT